MKKRWLFFLIICINSSFNPARITWVAIGDSITYLNDHLDETGHRVKKGYMTRVKEQLPYVAYTNQGYNGWTSGGIAGAIDKLGLQKADVYSIFLGTNDWWQGRPVGTLKDYQNNSGNNTVYGSFRIIIDKLRSLNSKAKIILITPMQRTDFVYIADFKNHAYGSYEKKNGQSLEQFANAIDSIGRYAQFTVIDLYHDKHLDIFRLVKYKRLKNPKTGSYQNYRYPHYIDIPFHPERDEYPYPAEAADMTYDGLHPSDKGYRLIADRVVAVLKKM